MSDHWKYRLILAALFASVIFVAFLNQPASAVTVKYGSSAEGWWIAGEIADQSISAGNVWAFPCIMQTASTNAVHGLGCGFPVATVITHFSIAVTRTLDADDEMGTIYIEKEGVEVAASSMAIGDGEFRTCDAFYPGSGNDDIDAIGDSCTNGVSIPLAVTERFRIGFTGIDKLTSINYYIRGTYQ